ncbi:MAG: hypothetical protein ABSC25_24335 [Roseiarcus sp.]|jgi:hypothetical protein
MLNVLRIVSPFREPPQPAPAFDPLADTLAERDKAVAVLERFAAFDRRVGDAQAASARADKALGEFDAAEADALRSWAEAGDGEAPRPDIGKRAEIVATREAAERELQAAVAARAIVQPAYKRGLATLAAIQLRLDRHRADAVAAEALREVAELRDIIADAIKRFARIIGAREALIREGLTYADRGAHDRAQPWQAGAAALADVTAVTIDCSAKFVEEHVAAWRAKIKGEV